MAKKLESKFWQEVKQNTPGISWTRLESWASAGVPDLLGYNKKGHFFTVELKVTRRNFVTFSPHQISFHSRHPENSFILIKHLGHGCLKLVPGSMLACLLEEGFACLSVDRARWSTVLACLLACWANACVLLACKSSGFMGAWAKAAGSWGLAQTLVFGICHVLNISRPAAPTVAALASLIWGRAGLHLSRYGRRPRPPLGCWSVNLRCWNSY